MSRPLVKSVFGNISPINLGEDFLIIEDANLKEIEGEDVRSESCIIFHCISGSLCLIAGSEKITIKTGQVVYLLKGQMLKILYVSGSLQVTLLLFFEPFLQCLDLKNYYFFRKNSGRIIKSTSYVAFEKFVKICRDIILYDKDSERKEVILLLVKAYLTGLSHFANETTDSKKPKNANERVMKEFIALLSSPSAIHMPLDYYARILNISPKHLSFISRYSTGFNALHWIDQYTILEAKSLLSNSDLVIYDIATRLHFSNQSVFGRFFKRHTGITPSAFRKERQKMT